MPGELQRSSSRVRAGSGSNPVQSQELARVLAGSNGRIRQNHSLNPVNQLKEKSDLKLVTVGGGASLRLGDEVSTNRSRQLVRPPRETALGGKRSRVIFRQEQERQTYLAAVVEYDSTDGDGYQVYHCVLLDREPPQQADRSGVPSPRTQADQNAFRVDADLSTTAQRIAVTVYGTSNWTYSEGDVIPVYCVRQWEKATSHTTRALDRQKKTVLTERLLSTSYYSFRYDQTGGE